MLDLEEVLVTFSIALEFTSGGRALSKGLVKLRDGNLKEAVQVLATYRFGGQTEFVGWRNLAVY